MKRRVLPSNGIFRVPPMRSQHLVKGSHPVALFETEDTIADRLDVACHVVSLVRGLEVWAPDGILPVLGVSTDHDHFDEDLLCFWGGNVGVADGDGAGFVYKGLLHGDW